QLKLPGAVGDLSEARLAHDALEHQPSADRHVRRIGIQPLAAALAEAGVQLAGERVAATVVRRRRSLGAQRGELRALLRYELVLIAAIVAAVIAAPGRRGVSSLFHVFIRPP